MHVTIDDATRLAYVEVLANEQKTTTIESRPCSLMVFRAVDPLPPGFLGECLRLPLRGLAKSLSGTGSETDPHQELDAADQRQSGTVMKTL